MRILVLLFTASFVFHNAAFAAGPEPTALISGARVGDSIADTRRTLQKLGIAEPSPARFDSPGAFAMGLFDGPSMLALLNRVGVDPPFFQKLPKSGPSFLRAKLEGAEAAYAFVGDRLWSMALSLSRKEIAPEGGPFNPRRLDGIGRSLRGLCPAVEVAGKDDYGNPIAWRSRSCAGGEAAIWYDARNVQATLQVVVWPR